MVRLVPPAPLRAQADVDDFVVSLGPGSGFTMLARTSVDLPAGPAGRVDISADDGGQWSVYLVAQGSHMHELWCRADELPADRWLPIALTIETGPHIDLESSPLDGTVTVSEPAFRMVFPEAWQVRARSAPEGLLYATGKTSVCSVSDYGPIAQQQGWTSAADMHAAFVATAEGRKDITVDRSGTIELPAGTAGYANLTFSDGTRTVRYSIGRSDAMLALFCVGQPIPDDDYASLMGSLEWLPAGPQAMDQGRSP